MWQDLCKGPKEGPKLKLKSQIPFAYGSIFPWGPFGWVDFREDGKKKERKEGRERNKFEYLAGWICGKKTGRA